MGGAISMMVVSLIFIGAAIYGLREMRKFKRIAVRTQGEVTYRHRYRTTHGSHSGFSGSGGGIHSTGGGTGSNSSYNADLRIRYRTVDGREVTATIEGMDGGSAPKVGRTVRILYDPNDTSQIKLDTMVGRGTCLLVPLLVAFTAVFIFATYALISTLTG